MTESPRPPEADAPPPAATGRRRTITLAGLGVGGVAGAALLAGCCLFNAPEAGPEIAGGAPAPAAPVAPAETAVADAAPVAPVPDAADVIEDTPPAETDVAAAPAPVAPADAVEEEPPAADAENTAQAASAPLTAMIAPAGPLDGGANPHMEFLVKMDGQAGARFRDAFLANPEDARRRFLTFAEENPEFAGLRLVRVSFGGELTVALEDDAPADRSAREALSARIAERLSAHRAVRYAEPNLVGWKGSTQP